MIQAKKALIKADRANFKVKTFEMQDKKRQASDEKPALADKIDIS